MASVNKVSFIKTDRADGSPDMFLGKVQAGTSATIKSGAICCYGKTAGYWTEISAVADSKYPLAIAAEEQAATDLTRNIRFYSLAPGDVFEFPMAAAAAVALGALFSLTASDAQKLTVGATGIMPVAVYVGSSNRPTESGNVTDRTVTYGQFEFLPTVSQWGELRNMRRVFITSATSLTLTAGQCYNGSTVCLTATGNVTLPPVQIGMEVYVYSNASTVIGVDPDAADTIEVNGAQGAAGGLLSATAADGNSVQVRGLNADGWYAIPHVGTWSVA